MPLRFRTVIFDCDSTLTAVEGIEELAREHRAEITRLTQEAMRGTIPLEDIYGQRLDLIRPTRRDVELLGARYISALVPGAAETVHVLQNAGVIVQILSGGLAPAVRTLARHLRVGEDRVAAVEIRFGTAGQYLNFDHDSCLTRSGGKLLWIEREVGRLPAPILLVGDGATDLEARPAVAAFAVYTGVVAREEIVCQADVVIPGPSLSALLPYCGLSL